MIRAFVLLQKITDSVKNLCEKRNNGTAGKGVSLRTSMMDASHPTQNSDSEPRSISRQLINEIGRTFDAIDVDGDGKLNQTDIKILFAKLGMPLTDEMTNEVVSAMDTRGDGVVWRDEFIEFYSECVVADDSVSPKEQARRLFDIFDADGSGEITASEFKETLEAFKLGFTLEDMGDILREIDHDGSGTISVVEFEELVIKYFPKENEKESGIDARGRPPSVLNLAGML